MGKLASTFFTYGSIFLLYPAKANAQRLATQILYNGPKSEAVEDMESVLANARAGTIILKKIPLEQRTGQEVYLETSPAKSLIIYTTQNSLENGIYTFLDLCGVRWYGAGEHWLVMPEKIVVPTITGKWIKPSFRNRSIYGTGGLDMTIASDPNNNFKKKWLAWKRRNRINADYEIGGHTGQAFYLANKALLDVHPEWFANEQGKKAGRIKVENNAAVEAYKRWVLKGLANNTKEFIALSVEPEDGRGGSDDPLPPSRMGLKNHADKWWWLANEVAKALPENNGTIKVSAYAYGDGQYNALAPSFPLHKNVYPVLVPYAFQKAYLPEEMVKVWASKINGTMGIYDFWNITQWSEGLPQFDIYKIPVKLKFWLSNKVDGLVIETTDAGGPMGHVHWLSAQLQWNVNQELNQLYHRYLKDCFGPAAEDLKAMFDRWSANYQGSADVALSLQNLKLASDKVNRNSVEWKRIADLKAYVHYMKLYYEHDGSEASRNNIYRYLYSIHHLMMVQTAGFLSQGYLKPGGAVPKSDNVHPLSYQEIEVQFQKDLQSNKPTYSINPFTIDPKKIKYTEPIANEAWRFGQYANTFYFYAPSSGVMEIAAGPEGEFSNLTIFSSNQIVLKSRIERGKADYLESIAGRTWSMKKFMLKVEKGQRYDIQLSEGFHRLKVLTPGIVLLKQPGNEDFDNYQYPLHYFYVPKQCAEIVFFDGFTEGFNERGYLINPSGIKQKRQKAGSTNIYKVQVPLADRGKVWKADFGHPIWSFKNIPNVASLQSFLYQE